VVHPAAMPVNELLSECRSHAVRRGGPGGQRRNKVETGVVLTHVPTGVEVEASERRLRRDNFSLAVRRLRLALAVEQRSSQVSDPSLTWQSRCQAGRVVVSGSHEDLPALLAEAMDHLMQASWEPSVAAQQLGCTSSQLTRLLRKWPAALERVNRERVAQGRHRLK